MSRTGEASTSGSGRLGVAALATVATSNVVLWVVASAAFALYVANFDDDSVSVIDGRTYAVTTTIPGVPWPTKIAIDTQSLYLLDTANYNDLVILNGGIRYDNYDIKTSGFGTVNSIANVFSPTSIPTGVGTSGKRSGSHSTLCRCSGFHWRLVF